MYHRWGLADCVWWAQCVHTCMVSSPTQEDWGHRQEERYGDSERGMRTQRGWKQRGSESCSSKNDCIGVCNLLPHQLNVLEFMRQSLMQRITGRGKMWKDTLLLCAEKKNRRSLNPACFASFPSSRRGRGGQNSKLPDWQQRGGDG